MATPRKTASKKKPAKSQGLAEKILVAETKVVDIRSLTTHHKNPRRGDIDKIAESLNEHGQFRPILVNAGTITGRTNEILAGNHTYLGARRLGWDTIYASFVDVDETTATKIVLADNRTADAGTYDDKVLAELFESLPDITGTGYDELEVEDLLASIAKETANMADEAAASIGDLRDLMPTPGDDYRPPARTEREEFDDEEDDDDREANFARGAVRADSRESDAEVAQIKQSPQAPSLAQVQAELQGILEVKEEMMFMGQNPWQIPDLREDMLVMDFPKNVQTWAGHEATPDDGEKHFFFNYGLGGMKGLPLDRAILAFNTHDDKFINWWDQPAYYASKLIAGGLRMAVCPDFSFYYTMPRFVHLQGVFRSQWIGRFLQEAGVRVIPRIQFDDEKSLAFNMIGIPKNPPYLEASCQNTRDDFGTKEESEERQAKILQKTIDTLQPTRGFIVYGGNPGRRILERLNLHGAEPIWIENYAAVRRGTVFDKKDGLASLSAKDRKAIREKARAEEEAKYGGPIGTSEPDYDEDDE